MSDDKPTVEGIEAGIGAAKDPEQLTQQIALGYPPAGDATEPKKRRTRSDAGRPRGPKTVGADAGPGQAVGGAEAGKAIGYSVDKKIVEKTASVVLGTVDSAVVRKIYNTAKALGGDDGISQNLAKDAGLTVNELNLMTELTGVIFEKYGLLTGYAPEILLGITMGEWGLRVTLVMRRLTVMEREAKQRAKMNEAVSQAGKSNSDR